MEYSEFYSFCKPFFLTFGKEKDFENYAVVFLLISEISRKINEHFACHVQCFLRKKVLVARS